MVGMPCATHIPSPRAQGVITPCPREILSPAPEGSQQPVPAHVACPGVLSLAFSRCPPVAPGGFPPFCHPELQIIPVDRQENPREDLCHPLEKEQRERI